MYKKIIIQDFNQPVMWLIPAIIFSACLVFFISWVYEKGSQKQEKDNGIKNIELRGYYLLPILLLPFRLSFFQEKRGAGKKLV